jgi:hypothetical protein
MCWEFGIDISLTVHLTSLYRTVSKSPPPATKQASKLMKIFLDTDQSCCLEMLASSH